MLELPGVAVLLTAAEDGAVATTGFGTILLFGFLIFFARICDVAIGTIRMMMVVRGARLISWVLGFFEAGIWALAAFTIFDRLAEAPILLLFYCLGFASGVWVGMLIEERMAVGERVIRVFTRIADDVSAVLRSYGLIVTEFEGRGRAGPVTMVYVKVARKQVGKVLTAIQETDPKVFWVIEDVRKSRSQGAARVAPAAAASNILQRK